MKQSIKVSVICILLIICSMASAFADAMFVHDTTQSLNGARAVIFITAQELGIEGYSDGIYLAAGGGGYYTSVDGQSWDLRAKGSFGGLTVDSNNSARCGAAYGGQADDKKAFLLSSTVGNNVHYTNADLSFGGTIAAADENGNNLFLTSVLWDAYTGKFWAGANTVNGSTITGAGNIYYSDGIINNGSVIWKKADLGSADLFSGISQSNISSARYVWINTNHKGDFAYGCQNVSQVGRARYKCGVLRTNQQVSQMLSKVFSLSDGAKISGDSEGDYTLETGKTTDAYGSQVAWDVKYAVIDSYGNLFISPGAIKTGKWYRLLRCNYTEDNASYNWVLGEKVQAIEYDYIVCNDQRLIAIPKGGPARKNDLRDKASVDFFIAEYDSNGVLQTGKLILKDVTNEIKIFGDDGTKKCVTGAVLNGDKLLITQTDTLNSNGCVIAMDLAGFPAYQYKINDQYQLGAASVRITHSQLLPEDEKTYQFNASSYDGNGNAVSEEIVWKKVYGEEEINITERGLVVIDPNASNKSFNMKVIAYDKSHPSIFDTLTISFDYIIAAPQISLRTAEGAPAGIGSGVIVNAKIVYGNPTQYDKSLYVVLGIYKGSKCVDIVLWKEVVSLGIFNLEKNYSYTLPNSDYSGAEARVYILDATTLQDIKKE